jgi:hypothetical protein
VCEKTPGNTDKEDDSTSEKLYTYRWALKPEEEFEVKGRAKQGAELFECLCGHG